MVVTVFTHGEFRAHLFILPGFSRASSWGSVFGVFILCFDSTSCVGGDDSDGE